MSANTTSTIDFDSIVSDLCLRETARRKAFLGYEDSETREQSILDLLQIWEADEKHPIGSVQNLDIRKVKPIKSIKDLPEPWSTRASIWGGR